MNLYDELENAKNRWKFIVDNAAAFKRSGATIVMDNDMTWIRFPYDEEADESLTVGLPPIGQQPGTIQILDALGIDSEYC